jgi:iron complex outermembrane receptor protein
LSTASRLRRTLVPAATWLIGAATASAADDPAVLDTVTVSEIRQPYRGDTPLQELPQSVQVLSSELLKDVGVTQLDGALDLVSGVARQNTLGGLWDSFAIRGFAGDENTPSGYLVNGFNAGRGFTGRRDPSNIDHIEVLKGPGSALYGRGEPGGTVNIVTKQPQFEPEGSVELSGGSFDTYRAAADYTGPVNDSIAFRINGGYENADSFRDYVSSKRYALTPSVLARLTSSTTLSYELEWIKQRAPLDRGVTAVNSVLGTIPESRFLGEPGDGDIKIDALGHVLSLQHQLNSNWSLLVGASYRDSSFEGFSSEAELLNARQLLFTNPNGGLLTRRHLFRTYDAQDLTGRSELSGKLTTGPITHHVMFGADAYKFDNDQQQTRFRPGAGSPVYSLNIYDPIYGIASPTLVPLTDRLEKQKEYGVYVQDQMDLTEHWKLLGGVRFDDYSQDILNRLGTPTTTHVSQTATSPRAGLVYQVNKQLSLYTSYSKGFRPNTGSTFAGQPFAPETSRSYEAGIKAESAQRQLSATLAAYQGKKSNFLTADPLNAGFSIAGGEAESKGLEFDASGRLMEDLRATISYAYTDATVSKDIVDVNFGYRIPAGSPLINIPKHSAHVLLIQDFHVKEQTLSVGAGAGYVSKRLGETGYLPEFDLPSYTLVNLIGAYAVSESLKLDLHVDNLLDKTYYPSSYSRFWVAVGEPRAYTLTAQYKF